MQQIAICNRSLEFWLQNNRTCTTLGEMMGIEVLVALLYAPEQQEVPPCSAAPMSTFFCVFFSSTRQLFSSPIRRERLQRASDPAVSPQHLASRRFGVHVSVVVFARARSARLFEKKKKKTFFRLIRTVPKSVVCLIVLLLVVNPKNLSCSLGWVFSTY